MATLAQAQAAYDSQEAPEYYLGGCDEGEHSWKFLGSNGMDDFYKCRNCGKASE